ncbi:MFS transporter [Nocardioides zeae]|uniref:Multidrug efflux pump Tap n=1 Tax=Nocardioides imazamoxiresistens TaxID=3231893 RepID=A0ABU3PVI3_9ACTN|nr:MFS transporter [Nocardioides zeae]MDT9593209.1 MFS transporter [Nocardioides zeae]
MRSPVVYLVSYGLSVLGNSVAAVVLPLVVLQTTGSALDAGIVAAATAVPAVLAGLFMGGVIDRVHRRTASVVTDVVSGLAIAALPLIDLLTGLSVGWFVLLGVVGSFGDVPGLTARETLLPGLARHAGLTVDRLLAAREGVGAVVLLVGPALAAGLVTFLDGTGALWVTAGLALAAALTTLLLPREVGELDAAPVGRSPRAALVHLREGWTWLFRSSPVLLGVTLLNLLLVTVLVAYQGLLLPVHFTLEGQEGRLGLVLSALAAGMLVGTTAYAVVGARLSRRTWFVVAMLGAAVGVGMVGALPPVVVVLLGAAVLGLFSGIGSTVLGVVMVERIPDGLRGRVMGTQNAIMTAAPSLGILGAAVLVDQVSPQAAGLAVAGLWCAGVLVALAAPALRDLDPHALGPRAGGGV